MYSPFNKTPLSAVKGQRGRKSSPFLSPSLRSLTTSFSRSILGQSFNESFFGNPQNALIECYGCPLPVLVTEAITVADRITDISVKLEPFGYASLVCGRQLLIWKYKQDVGEKSVVHCKELTLPPSDLAHKAELVHLFLTEDSKLPSALAVSPEGHVRYWPNINHEGSSVDATTDLQGQECYSLTSVYPLGCILATTTCSLVLVTPTIREGQPSVICRPLTLPLGVLAGIGRKVHSFIFGVVPAQTTETKQLNRVLSVKDEEGDYVLYVLSSTSLQKWHITRKDKRENTDQLLFEADLDRQLKQNFAEELFKNETCLMPSLKTWCLDMQLCPSGVMILTAGTVPTRSERNIYYAFAVLMTSSDQPPQNFSSFCVTKHIEVYEENDEEKLLNFKFILPNMSSQFAYIYNSEKVLCVQTGVQQSEISELNFANTGNLILGSGSCEGLPLFFTKDFGVVSFVQSQLSVGDSRFLSSMKEVTIRQPDPKAPPESLSVKLRSAMYSYCKGDMESCEKMITEISTENSDLDEAVVSLSLGIIDDYPVSDPRWCESLPAGSVSSSLIISYQLEDKLKAHECLLGFLKAFDLFDKLSCSKVGDVIIPTKVLLCEHAEKINAAKALRLFLTDHNEVIESAIRESLYRRNIEVKSHLTPQDVFFREVSAFHTVFPSLLDWEIEELNTDESLPKALNAIMTVNKILAGLLEAVTEYRRNKTEIYGLHDRNLEGEFLPWTARNGSSGIRGYLRQQLDINVHRAMKITDSIQIQGVLFQQYMEILDFYLGSYKSQLDSLKPDKQTTLRKEYEKERNDFIEPLLAVGQYERAAALAEKYLDFGLLIRICEQVGNNDRLQRYMVQFSEQKFSEFVFKWYLDKGQRGKIFDKQLGQKDVLSNFLQNYEKLKWIYHMQEEEYDAAHSTLKELALKETEFLSRKKTLLSLSKLAALVNDAPEDLKNSQIEAINVEQDLITHQEALPVATVENCGFDPKNMRVFTPEELIELYVSEENTTANAFDFKIALDLLQFIKKPPGDPDVNNLRMHIWSRAVLKDNWDELDINNPLEAIKETVFFQIIELAFDQGAEMHDFIPAIDDLLQSPELSNLSDNPSFKFLIQVGYEYILKIID